jgi:hypothetical protein
MPWAFIGLPRWGEDLLSTMWANEELIRTLMKLHHREPSVVILVARYFPLFRLSTFAAHKINHVNRSILSNSFDPTADRPIRRPCCFRNSSYLTITDRLGFGRRPAPTAPLVQVFDKGVVLSTDSIHNRCIRRAPSIAETTSITNINPVTYLRTTP